MKPPASGEAWRARIGASEWKKTWKLRPMYAAPRDMLTLLKVQHRNLWTAQHSDTGQTTCGARDCMAKESQLHLVECSRIQVGFWDKVRELMRKMGMVSEGEPGDHPGHYWMALHGPGDKC
jgi:hypothetical protein